MFRVEFMCDDRRLAAVLRALAGLVLGTPSVQPVVNAEQKNGKVEEKENGTVGEMMVAQARREGVLVLDSDYARAYLKKNGQSPDSASYHLRSAVSLGLLRRTGKGSATKYVVK